MEENKNQNNQTRPPIVVVLGHVDHGKTTLLDAIRKTNVAGAEAGGITQAIGASVIEVPSTGGINKKITFIDTPGHAAFTKMRSRGAKIADIAVLVVAQDDGVAPQTKEALQIIRDAKIPFLVAGTKADVVGVNVEALKGQLEKEQVFFEGRGGDVPFFSVSAKIGTGIKELLEMIILMSEVADLKGDPAADLEGVVIESNKEKMGQVASVVVRNGSIKVGQTIFAEEVLCKVRGLFDDKGKTIREVLPGYPAKVIGFSLVPPVGARVGENPEASSGSAPPKARGTFDLRRLREDEIPIIIKASNAGALEAIIASIPPKIIVVDNGVGEINSSDVIAAKTGNAYIFSFESKIGSDVTKLAEAENVRLERFEIIYEFIQRLEEILKKGKIQEIGRANILASFPFNNKKVAGAKVVSGRITKGDTVVLLRNEKTIGKAKIVSIRKQKNEVASVGPSEEFGAILEPQLDFGVGDVIVSIR
ncbi:MAG: Translation initiation factor IF-2 [Candidatus Woesebacteria bacterium GW2011_GWA2_40_7]|uniref:Translation initiation factor IF-2 n=3 Tax=Candidatus Woeseibacteriota TaxID=1752722 RepID=A0A0G0LM61_9BACT|nr:MAG: Translation initiation factor IF-2 [Candidatus Woesebacteria bacterium GW2011_GWB1_39_10]KKR73499.1 MAG: Translation initiation factor IF-2 [Candidatus Woesebacteria bacterium GW2011_GWA2_40_7]KKS91057.1 MAG: Translation initiation factor IF-2 [Candidatus Woesebacteria bacterium GW2011_GWA1_43_12]